MSENQNTRDNQNEQILALLQTLTADVAVLTTTVNEVKSDMAVLKTDMQDVKLRSANMENNGRVSIKLAMLMSYFKNVLVALQNSLIKLLSTLL